MKKTTPIFKSLLAITVLTIFVACKKDIEEPKNDLTRDPIGNFSSPATVDVVAIGKPKTSNGIVGDSTKAVKQH